MPSDPVELQAIDKQNRFQYKLAALARRRDRTTVIVVEVDKEMRVPGYESWWDVPVAEVSEVESVRSAREHYEKAVKKERFFL